VSAALQELEQAWPGGLEQVPQCPVCGELRREGELSSLRDASFGAAPGAWSLQRCLGCRALYLDPRPDATSIHLAYRNYFTHVSVRTEARVGLAWLKHAMANGYRNRLFGTTLTPSLAIGGFLTPLFPATADHIRREDRGIGHSKDSRGRILDVGCGNGHFLGVVRRLGWLGYGVEIDTIAAAAARGRGCEILGSQLGDLSHSYDQFFDVITLSHVIEHLHDPVSALRHCRRLLKQGGYVWIETPNTDSVGYEIYGGYWRGLEPPRHLVLFNSRSLRSCLQRAGFERIRILPPRDAGERLFTLSAAMQLGRIAERDRSPLPRDAREHARTAAATARSTVLQDPERSEFVAAIAH
jgi:2-polyprenyl-3-methyl-5-hydroxy-6-metoxy-1,4-benzoquinol methylase